MTRDELRILDASLNRAAEALRVAEDVCRFAFELPVLARTLKEARHTLLAAFAPGLSQRAVLAGSRDSDGDVGRSHAVAPPNGLTVADVAVRNLERAREALRTLEEISALSHPGAAAAASTLRYRLYSLEKGFLRLTAGASAPLRGQLEAVTLYLIADPSVTRLPFLDAVRAAIEGGASAVQLRTKGCGDREKLDLARAVRALTLETSTLFLLNDRIDLALLAHADGVHLGQDDLSVAHARRLLGDRAVIGVSTHSVEEAERAALEGADYIGAGAFRGSTTKDVQTVIGVHGVRAIVATSPLPVFPIGGIRDEDLPELVSCGARRAAVASAILGQASPEQVTGAARRFVEGLAGTGAGPHVERSPQRAGA